MLRRLGDPLLPKEPVWMWGTGLLGDMEPCGESGRQDCEQEAEVSMQSRGRAAVCADAVPGSSRLPECECSSK